MAVSGFIRKTFGTGEQALTFTASHIGKLIDDSRLCWPIREYASKVATKANRRDYLGQFREIYRDVMKRWRYVRDPWGAEMIADTPERLLETVIGTPQHPGASDCDEIAAMLGCLARAIGFDALIRTVAIKSNDLPDHVHIIAILPGGYLSMDPVVEPDRSGFGFWPIGSRDWVFMTSGQLVWSKDSGEQKEIAQNDASRTVQ